MSLEKAIQKNVSSSIDSVIKSDQEPITRNQLEEIITKSIASTLTSNDFLNHINRALGEQL